MSRACLEADAKPEQKSNHKKLCAQKEYMADQAQIIKTQPACKDREMIADCPNRRRDRTSEEEKGYNRILIGWLIAWQAFFSITEADWVMKAER